MYIYQKLQLWNYDCSYIVFRLCLPLQFKIELACLVIYMYTLIMKQDLEANTLVLM